jgi:methyl-accepting chemotaxis protein
VFWTGLLAGVGAGVLVVLFLTPAIRFSKPQLSIAVPCAVVAAVCFSALSGFLQKPRIGKIVRYLERRPSGELTQREWRDAFEQVMNFPRFLVLFSFSQWVFMGVTVSGALFLKFETFTLPSAALTCSAAITGGFLSQIFVFRRLKRIFEPIREALAREIRAPAERGALVRRVPLATKMFIAITGLMLSSAIFSAALAHGRAARAIEAFSNARQRSALRHLAEEIGPAGGPARVLADAEASPFAEAMDFLLLDPTAQRIVYGRDDALIGEEIESLRSAGPEAGDSGSFESLSSFSWVRISGDGRILVAVTPPEVARAGLDRTGWFVVAVSATFILFAVMVARAVSRDFGIATGALEAALQRVAVGNLTRGQVFESEDELGDLGRSVDAMADSLRGTMRKVLGASDRVEGAGSEILAATERVISVHAEQISGIQQAGRSMDGVNVQVRGIAESAQVLNRATEESSESIAALGSVGEELGESGSLLQERVADVSSSIDQLSRSIREVVKSTDGLAEASLGTSRKVEGVAEALQQVDANASDASELSARVVESAELGSEKVNKTVEGMARIRTATRSVESVIRSLGDRAEAIGATLGVIDDVAARTNMLALNAAIISARSGEHGRAFSVVAQGIKELADLVLANTKEIASVIGALQGETERAVRVIEQGSLSVEEGVALSAEAGSALEAITQAARDSGERSEQIVHAVRQQSWEASHMVDLMGQVSALRRSAPPARSRAATPITCSAAPKRWGGSRSSCGR